MTKPITKAEWIAALRSGKYKQARGAFAAAGGLCCLAVLYTEAEAPPPARIRNTPDYVQLSRLLTDFHITNKLRSKLITMNDSKRKSFVEIADYLETL